MSAYHPSSTDVTFLVQFILRIHNADMAVDIYQYKHRFTVMAKNHEECAKLTEEMTAKFVETQRIVAEQNKECNTILIMKVVRAVPPLEWKEEDIIKYNCVFIVKNLETISIDLDKI